MTRRLMGACAIAVVLVLTGCTPTPGEPEPADPIPSVAPSVEAVVDEVEHTWVQDLWVYESIAKIDPSGEPIDLTGGILSHLDATDGQEHDLPDGARFVVHPSLEPRILGPDGEVRTDVEVVAGILTDGDARGFAVLATPEADAPAPIGLNDHIDVDLTFLDDLAVGDVLSYDIAFVQTFPGAAPSELDPVALLAHRLENGDVQYYGSDDEVGVFRDWTGQVVAGSLLGRTAAKEGPMEDAFRDAFDRCRADLKCVNDYFRKFGKGVAESWSLISCNLSPSCAPDGDGSKKPAQCVVGVKGGGCSEVRGDPHITTVDGRALSMQAVGEFLGLSTSGFEVQIRTSPWTNSRTVSMLSAVALRSPSTSVMVDIFEGQLRLRIEGEEAPAGPGAEVELSDLTVRTFPGAIEMVAPGGDFVVVRQAGSGHLSMTASVDEDSEVTGLLAGTGLDEDAGHEEFYDEFVNSWRITDEDSAFTYDDGSTTADFTDLTFPDQIVTMDTLPAADRARAQALCEHAGISSPAILAECIFDYAVTGAIEFVRAAKLADAIEEASERAGTTPEPAEEPVSVADAWRDTASYRSIGDVVEYICPPDGVAHAVWGGHDGIYTADSSVCTAAVHRGDITMKRGGTVTIERTEGQETYGLSTTRNGVTTGDWDASWSGSFIILSAK